MAPSLPSLHPLLRMRRQASSRLLAVDLSDGLEWIGVRDRRVGIATCAVGCLSGAYKRAAEGSVCLGSGLV